MQAETRFKEKVLSKLKDIPKCFVIKLQQVSKVGDPDIILCVNGFYIAFELKVGNNKVTKLQQYKLDKIVEAGGIARVVTPENLGECLEEIKCLVS